jgi:3-(3-hydroxy-phenyl)propionate hydroxylase
MNDDLISDVVVVGAGPTGLTLANLLGHAGVRVLLIERNESTVTAPRAVSIDDESLRTMQAIGLIDAVMRDVAADYGSHYFTAGGRCFARVEPATREYGFPRRNAFTQPQLESTLLQGLRRFPNVTVMFRHSVESIEESPFEVTLRTETDDGNGLCVRARYVAACDGARSMFRKHIGAKMLGQSYPQRWLIVDLATTNDRLRQTRVVCDPRRPFITLPGPNGIRRYEFMLNAGEEDEAAAQPEFVRRLLESSGPDADVPVVRRQVYTFHALIADTWSTDRIFLAGDAAHLSPPFAGQGMNSGVRDSFNLGWKLAAVVQNRLGPQILKTYFEEREPHASALIRLAVNMGRVMMPRSPLQALFVQTAFRLARFAPGAQSYFAQMKYKPKPFYRQGFLVPTKEFDVVGRMLPQPLVEQSGGQRCLLDERLGSGFCLLAYGKDAQARVEEASSYNFGIADLRTVAILPSIFNPDRNASPDVEVVRDVNGMLATILPEDPTVLMLVRPDRYIMAATSASPAAMAARVRNLIESY